MLCPLVQRNCLSTAINLAWFQESLLCHAPTHTPTLVLLLSIPPISWFIAFVTFKGVNGLKISEHHGPIGNYLKTLVNCLQECIIWQSKANGITKRSRQTVYFIYPFVELMALIFWQYGTIPKVSGRVLYISIDLAWCYIQQKRLILRTRCVQLFYSC